jgi:cell division protein FtsI (penicillin-binding protein 3)
MLLAFWHRRPARVAQGARASDGTTLAQYGLDHRLRTIPLPAERGAIRDRHGAPLALSLDARDIYADPRLVTDATGTAERIAEVLGVKPKTLLPDLTADATFTYLARQVDEDVAHRIMRLQPDRLAPGAEAVPGGLTRRSGPGFRASTAPGWRPRAQ